MPWRAWELAAARQAGKEHAMRAHDTQMTVTGPSVLASHWRSEL
jgi:hypothetical protein